MKGRRIPSCRAAKQPHTQRACYNHQSTGRCSVRESPTRPHSSPPRLDPQASPIGAAAPAPNTIRSTLPLKQLNPSYYILSDPLTVIYSSCSQAPRLVIFTGFSVLPRTVNLKMNRRQPNQMCLPKRQILLPLCGRWASCSCSTATVGPVANNEDVPIRTVDFLAIIVSKAEEGTQ